MSKPKVPITFRDNTLDYLKGIACLLMVLIHTWQLSRTTDFSITNYFWHLGALAPIFFIATLGASILYLRKKYSLVAALVFCIGLVFVGFADLGRVAFPYFSLTLINLFGSLGLISFLVLILPKKNWLLVWIIGPLIFNKILDHFAVPHSVLYGLLFSVIPWMSFGFWGIFIKTKSSLQLLGIQAVLIAILFFETALRHHIYVDQSSTTLFITTGLLVYTFTLWLLKKIKVPTNLGHFLSFLGKRTLLFYWLHLFMLYILPIKLFAPIEWVFILVITLVLIRVLEFLNCKYLTHFTQTWNFWLMLVGSLFIPLIYEGTPEFRFYYFHVIVFLFALNYKQLIILASKLSWRSKLEVKLNELFPNEL